MTDKFERLGGKWKYLDILIFFVACYLLWRILANGNTDTNQDNLIYLVELSLACAMVFAFLPFSASFHYNEMFKAGGTAAIFGLCLYTTTQFSEHRFNERLDTFKSQNADLLQEVKDKDDLIQSLTIKAASMTNKDTAEQNRDATLRMEITQSLDALSAQRTALAEGTRLASAARDNSKDGGTCSTRAGQSLPSLATSASQGSILLTNLNSAQTLLGK